MCFHEAYANKRSFFPLKHYQCTFPFNYNQLYMEKDHLTVRKTELDIVKWRPMGAVREQWKLFG